MQVKKFAWTAGWVMLVLGVIALIPNLSGGGGDLPNLNLETSYGMFLGIFPMNILNKLALIGLGVAGIAVSRSQSARHNSIIYSQVVCVTLASLAVLGLIPATQTLGGYWPLFSAEVGAHAVIAAFAGYFGFATKERKMADVHSIRDAA